MHIPAKDIIDGRYGRPYPIAPAISEPKLTVNRSGKYFSTNGSPVKSSEFEIWSLQICSFQRNFSS
jgi:hypothetical protein